MFIKVTIQSSVMFSLLPRLRLFKFTNNLIESPFIVLLISIDKDVKLVKLYNPLSDILLDPVHKLKILFLFFKTLSPSLQYRILIEVNVSLSFKFFSVILFPTIIFFIYFGNEIYGFLYS